MSKPRYNWWGFALAMIRDYPHRQKELQDMHEQKITANLSGMPGSRTASRTTEGVALKQLQPQAQREFDAVDRAIKRVKGMAESKLRMEVVRITLWKGYAISTAAMWLNISDRTARRYRWQFVLLVGHMYGFLSEEEYIAASKKDAPR